MRESRHKHKMVGTRIYKSWSMMKNRCSNKNNPYYKNYGGRGIKVCDEWLNFINFYADMGERPKGKSLDRIDNNKGYCKSNCKWATREEQMNNMRRNHLITYNGRTQNVSQWAKEFNIKNSVVFGRLKIGWSIEKALMFKINN